MAPKAELHLGDCLALLPGLPRDGAVVSDPPYGIGHKHSGKGAPPPGRLTVSRHHTPIEGDGEEFDPSPWVSFPYVLLWGANHFARRLHGGRWLVWDKLAGMKVADSFSDVEFAWCNRGRASRIISHRWKGIACSKADRADVPRQHPNQKPVAVMTWAIQQLGLPPGTTIIDPYMGAGTTGLAAARLGHPFIGIELDPIHFATARRRINEEIDKTALLTSA